MSQHGEIAGRVVLGLLAAIHLVLPLTPANEHNELQIYVAAALIGGLFGCLMWMSFARPRKAFVVGAVAFVTVEAVAAASGASPVAEGWVVKFALTTALAYAVMTSSPRNGVDSSVSAACLSK